jgi:hypothetical protein
MVMAGVEWYQIDQTHGFMPFNWLRSRHYYERSSPRQPLLYTVIRSEDICLTLGHVLKPTFYANVT